MPCREPIPENRAIRAWFEARVLLHRRDRHGISSALNSPFSWTSIWPGWPFLIRYQRSSTNLDTSQRSHWLHASFGNPEEVCSIYLYCSLTLELFLLPEAAGVGILDPKYVAATAIMERTLLGSLSSPKSARGHYGKDWMPLDVWVNTWG